MNTAVINIKVDPKVKKQAHKIADELGFSLSSLINGYLKHLIRVQKIEFAISEEPSEYLIKSLKESQEDIKKGRVVSFENSKDAIAYLRSMTSNNKKIKNHDSQSTQNRLHQALPKTI